MFLQRPGSGPASRDIVGANAPLADTGATTQQSSFSESGTTQTLVFGIAGTLLAIVTIYFSYRQFQEMRNQHYHPLLVRGFTELLNNPELTALTSGVILQLWQVPASQTCSECLIAPWTAFRLLAG